MPETESGKKFGMAEIILMMMIAFFDDVMGLLAWGMGWVPILGQAILFGYWVLDWLVGVLFLGWFIIKLGVFGAPAIWQAAGAAMKMIGIPTRTITAGIGIYLANHPKVAAVAVAVETGGAGAATAEKELAQAGSAAEEAAAAEREAGAARIEARAEKTTIRQAEGGTGEREIGRGRGESPEPQAEEAGEPGAGQDISEEYFGMEPLGKVKEVEDIKQSFEKMPETRRPGEREERTEEEGLKVVDIASRRKMEKQPGQKGEDNPAERDKAA